MTRRVLFVGNVGDDDPGLVGEELVGGGWEPTRLAREQHASWHVPEFDLLVLLGSDWSVHWRHHEAVVGAETALFLEAHRHGVPVLGICYGAQLIARALGGSVGPMARPEIGWYDVAAEDHVLAGPWFEWHGDSFVVPPGHVALARTADAPQAFASGRSLAVQFHPEVTDSMIEQWIGAAERAPVASVAVDPEEMRRRAAVERDARPKRARTLVQAFLQGSFSPAPGPSNDAGRPTGTEVRS